MHFAELSKTDDEPYPLHDFTSSGLTHVNEEYPKAPNRYRVAGPFVDLNFGLVEIDWDAKPSPLVTMRVVWCRRSHRFRGGGHHGRPQARKVGSKNVENHMSGALLLHPALDPELDRTWVFGVRARWRCRLAARRTKRRSLGLIQGGSDVTRAASRR